MRLAGDMHCSERKIPRQCISSPLTKALAHGGGWEALLQGTKGTVNNIGSSGKGQSGPAL